jgi:hypothetical protein
VAASALLLLKHRHNWALLLLGVITSLKIVPSFYWPLFIALVPGRRPKLVAALWGLAGLAMPVLLSAVSFPELMSWFFLKSMGWLPGQNAPMLEKGGVNNPTFYFMLNRLFLLHLGPLASKIFFVVVFILLAAISVYVWKRIIPNVPETRRREFTISLGIVATTLFLPRLKPYSLCPPSSSSMC